MKNGYRNLKMFLTGLIICGGLAQSYAQYDSIVGSAGCQAVNCNDMNIKGWATACDITRGCQDVATKAMFASFGTEDNAVGKASDVPTQAVSLGDSGVAVLTFDIPIYNGEGYDFAVFENSLNDVFLELAFVEVSSDGVHYVRFPAVSNTQTSTQVGTFGNLNAALLHNLAGKYRSGWGTPFDLEDLKDSLNININQITHVKIIDVIGAIQQPFTAYDSKGQAINDPYPTDFNSGGFDLTGVAILNGWYPSQVMENMALQTKFYPNPVNQELTVTLGSASFQNAVLYIYNVAGQQVLIQNLSQPTTLVDVSALKKGIYFIKINSEITKLIKQ